MFDRLFRFADKLNQDLNNKPFSGTRVLNVEDIDSFDRASQTRDAPIASDEALDEYLHRKNPARWSRLKRDFAWAQKHLSKAGVNPEILRRLL